VCLIHWTNEPAGRDHEGVILYFLHKRILEKMAGQSHLASFHHHHDDFLRSFRQDMIATHQAQGMKAKKQLLNRLRCNHAETKQLASNRRAVD
jgi:hypothetical protein